MVPLKPLACGQPSWLKLSPPEGYSAPWSLAVTTFWSTVHLMVPWGQEDVPALINVHFTGGGGVSPSCPTLCNPLDCSLPGSSCLVILQTRLLEWVAIPFSRRSSQTSIQTWVSCITGRFFSVWITREVRWGRMQIGLSFYMRATGLLPVRA